MPGIPDRAPGTAFTAIDGTKREILKMAGRDPPSGGVSGARNRA